MLDNAALTVLNQWCRSRDLNWSATTSAGGGSATLIRHCDGARPWDRMILVLDEPEFRLENELGETLASASALPALLDAVDGGVAEPPALPPRVLAGLFSLPSASIPAFALLAHIIL